MALQRGSEIEQARRRIEERRRRSVDADLAGLERQRATADQARADQEREAAGRLEQLQPAAELLAQALRDLERRTPEIRRQRLHDVTVCLRQPGPDCVRVSLRWGTKFALTDAEKQLMHGYRRGPRRLRRYPEVVVAQDYREVWGALDGSDGTLRLSSGRALPIERLVDDPGMVAPWLSEALARPEHHTRYHLRATDYEPSPVRP